MYRCLIDCPRHCSFDCYEERPESCPQYPHDESHIIFIDDNAKTIIGRDLLDIYRETFKHLDANTYGYFYADRDYMDDDLLNDYLTYTNARRLEDMSILIMMRDVIFRKCEDANKRRSQRLRRSLRKD